MESVQTQPSSKKTPDQEDTPTQLEEVKQAKPVAAATAGAAKQPKSLAEVLDAFRDEASAKTIQEEKKSKKGQAKDEEESKEMTLESSLAVREENDVRIAVIGNVDSGKSTLVGVLTKGVMDDGRGKARAKVFNFEHEQKNGRTSSIG